MLSAGAVVDEAGNPLLDTNWTYTRETDTLFVDAGATGDGSGAWWTDAFNHLQDALTAAESAGGTVTEIWVANGTYMPDGGYTPAGGEHHPGSEDRAATFRLLDGVAIYGGFEGADSTDYPGGETQRDQRDVDSSTSGAVLSGDLRADDVEVEDPADLLGHASRSDNSYHVVTATDTVATAVLDGFKITGGNADAADPQNQGGGMFADRGGPTLNNCTFMANTADVGGAVAVHGMSSVLTNCVFIGNAAKMGAAIGNLTNLSLTLDNCTFIGNVAGDGGAIWSLFNPLEDPTGSGVVRATSSTFTDNSATAGTGGWGFGDGGAINNWGNSSVVLINCMFNGNSASRHGGAVGHEVYTGGIILALTNCTFSGNTAASAGGIYTWASGGTYLTNCILWENSDATGSGLAAQIGADPGAPPPVVTYSCIQDDDGPGGTMPFGGSANQNVDWDPRFISASNLHLMGGSSCIDGGNNNADTDPSNSDPDPLPATDIDGDARIINGDGLAPVVVDIGADEMLYDRVEDVPPGGSVILNPGGGAGDPTEEALVHIRNTSGAAIDVSASEMPGFYWPGAGGQHRVLNTTLSVSVSPAGSVVATLVIPFDRSDLTIGHPRTVRMTYYNTSTLRWELAVSSTGSYDNTPPPPSLTELAARPVGDWGVYWDEAEEKGFVWAVVDHLSDFAAAVPLGDLDGDDDVDAGDFQTLLAAFGRSLGDPQYDPAADLDGDGTVTFADYQIWLGYYREFVGSGGQPQGAGVPGDLDGDGDVDLDDFAMLKDCFDGPGVEPGGMGCFMADFDYDGDVDVEDFAVLQMNFTGTP